MRSRLQRMRRVLLAARRLPKERREALLQESFGDDPNTLAEARALLRHDPEKGLSGEGG